MKATCRSRNTMTGLAGEIFRHWLDRRQQACCGTFGFDDVVSDLYTHVPEHVIAEAINKLPQMQP